MKFLSWTDAMRKDRRGLVASVRVPKANGVKWSAPFIAVGLGLLMSSAALAYELVPAMTSSSAPSGIVSQSETQGTFYGWQAFDKGPAVWATSTVGSHWISYDFPTGVTRYVRGYSITCSTGYSNTYSPRDFRFEVNQSGVWNLADIQTGVAAWTGTKNFTLASPMVGRAVRLVMSANNGGNIYMLQEIGVDGENEAPAPTPAPTAAPTAAPSVAPSVAPSSDPSAAPSGGTYTLRIPVIEDPAWLPAWQTLFYIVMKGIALVVIGKFFGRIA